MRRLKPLLVAGMIAAALVAMAAPAGAAVEGPCDGTAEWKNTSPPLEIIASDLSEGEVVEIPLAGTVEWTGQIDIPMPTDARDTSGHVQIRLPAPFGLLTVENWATSGTLIENSGTYTYDFPSVLAGFEVTVEGAHWEGTLEKEGPPTCSGVVILTLEGTNPIGFVAGGLTIVSLMGAYLAIRVKGGSTS